MTFSAIHALLCTFLVPHSVGGIQVPAQSNGNKSNIVLLDYSQFEDRDGDRWHQDITTEMMSDLSNAVVSHNQCDEYMESVGCGWTSEYRCPDQPNEEVVVAKRDAAIGYICCCDLGMWSKSNADKGALTMLQDRGHQCSAAAAADAEFAMCDWTQQHPCPDQYRNEDFVSDAVDTEEVSDLQHTCCCTLGHWKTRVDREVRSFQQRLDAESLEASELMFVHIPKTAGTAIEDAAGEVGQWYPRKWTSFWHGVRMPDGSNCEKYHVPPQYLSALGEPASDRDVFKVPNTFCITRHPYDRAVSEYLYQLSVDWGRAMSEQYRTGLYDEMPCTRKGLNAFLKKALTLVSEGRKFLHDCHFVPQHEFVISADKTRWCQHVLHFEDLPHAFNHLMQEHGVAARLDEQKSNNSTQACDGKISRADLDTDTRTLLNFVYEDDFSLFNYSHP